MTTKEIIEQTKELMQIRSTSDRPEALQEAVRFVEAIVAKVPGVTVEHFERSGKPSFLAYRGDVRPKKFDILLNGHMDVVPAKPAEFKPRVKDGRLYGRGALDMKGTALVLTDVFCELVNEVPYSLGLQIVSDEEIGGYDGVRHQISEGVRANFVIMGEYANHPQTIYNAARGLCWAEIAFSGKSAHGGHLWHGSNAVVKAGDFAGAVLRRYPTPDEETWTTTASIASLSTPNDTFNKVPDSALLKIDFRFTQEDPVFRNRESLEALVSSIDPDARIVNLATFEPAVNVEELNPYVQGMSEAMVRETGKKPRFLGRPAGSDGRHFALVNNNTVEYGLYGQGSHSAHEYVELDSFAEYQAVLQRFLRNPIPKGLQQRVADEAAKTSYKKPTHVWYANYGSGLYRENFMLQINGGQPNGSITRYLGCTDKTPPAKDVFLSLPYNLFFSGSDNPWDGGGYINIETLPSPSAHTISRAYLITLEQFEEITAQQNERTKAQKLPLKESMEVGHATIGDGSGHYDELVYCGMRDNVPMFSLTATRPQMPYTAPAAIHTKMLMKGLSEYAAIDKEKVIEYVLGKPGIKGNYKKRELEQIFADALEPATNLTNDAYVWYATYGYGLSKEHFAKQITGGESGELKHHFRGCTNKTLPKRDEFIALPYDVFFAGTCTTCGGGHIGITTVPSKKAHTIARAHLITVEQFKEITAEHNDRHGALDLPFEEAIKNGHATIEEGKGTYDELVYCGTKDGIPMFSLTATKPQAPYLPPSPGYARLLCIGLSENIELSEKKAIEYMASAPGIAGNYKKDEIAQLFHAKANK